MLKIPPLLIHCMLVLCLMACSEEKKTKTDAKTQQITLGSINSLPGRHPINPKSPAPDTIPFDQMFDIIEADSIAIGNNSGNVYSTGSEESFLAAFGPAKGERFYSEIVDETRIYYELDGLHAEFDTAGNNVDIGITKPIYKMRIGSHWYKPGDAITILQKQFPRSYKSREDHRIFIGLTLRGQPLDANIAIFYDDKGIITWMTSGANES